jgi:hypothetical protein
MDVHNFYRSERTFKDYSEQTKDVYKWTFGLFVVVISGKG